MICIMDLLPVFGWVRIYEVCSIGDIHNHVRFGGKPKQTGAKSKDEEEYAGTSEEKSTDEGQQAGTSGEEWIK